MTVHFPSYLLALGLVCACTPEDADLTDDLDGSDDTGTEDSDTADTAADTGDTGTDTGDTGTDTGDTGDPAPEGTLLRFESSPVTEDLAAGIALVHADGSVTTFDTAVIDETGAALFHLDAPAPAERYPLGADGVRGAMLLPFGFEDLDGDGKKDRDEQIVGAGPTFLVWAERATNAGGVELVAGWNALMGTSGRPLDALPLSVDSFLPVERVDASGTVYSGFTPRNRRLAVVSVVTFEDGGEPLLLSDEVLHASFDLSLNGAPPASHAYGDDYIPEMTLETAASYLDVDGSGSWNEPLEDAVPVCYAGEPVVFLWLPTPTDEWDAVNRSMRGLGAGWMALRISDLTADAPLPLDPRQRSRLVVGDPACTW